MSRPEKEDVYIYGSIEKETERAYLFRLPKDTESCERDHWIPKSQVEDEHVGGKTYDWLLIRGWLVDKKGIDITENHRLAGVTTPGEII